MRASLFKNYYYLIISMQNRFGKHDAIIQALRNKGYKATPQRIAICQTALNSTQHPNAQKVYHEVKKLHPTLSLATVYKTLQILTEIGLIQELNFPQEQARFDPHLKPHINLVCLQCGNIQDIDDPTIKELVTKTAKKANFTPTQQRIDIYGTCKKCQHKTKQPKQSS
ncbi:MAG: transcriptional repressor [Candidatus Bathyarchaeota archaeon]|nr:transcriptional repressor [Candidatus Bathyarchaeota archaeon]